METERIYRQSIPGIFFLAGLILFYLLFGGSLSTINTIFQKEKLISLAAAFITTPIIGFLISTIAAGTIFSIWSHRIYINDPSINNELSFIILGNNEIRNRLQSNNRIEKRRAISEFYWLYQAHIRASLNETTIKFLERRWNFFWIHVNNLTAVLLSLILNFFLSHKGACFNKQFQENKLILLGLYLLLLAYCIMAFRQAVALRRDAIRVEEEAVIKNYYLRK